VFPKGKHDDQVDSTAQMLDWQSGLAASRGGINQYYKELAQQAGAFSPQRPASAQWQYANHRRIG
jgi:hypothetical protein